MFSKTQKYFAVALLAISIAIGIVGYTFPGKSGPPEKVWFGSSGGDVIFDHLYHVDLAECNDCHHNADGEMNCRSCHYYGSAAEVETEDPHPRGIGANCLKCHQTLGESMSKCDACHIRMGFAFEEAARTNKPLPKLIKMETDNGRVDFDHELHKKEAGCADCHHEFKGGKEMMGMEREKNCRACHYKMDDKIKPFKGDENHERYIGGNCMNCHDSEDCGYCHKDE